MKFKSDYSVYVCPHVFEEPVKTNEVIRDPDGDWQFLCGNADCIENSEPKLVGVGHLLEKDSSLEQMANLKLGTFAERRSSSQNWVYGELDE